MGASLLALAKSICYTMQNIPKIEMVLCRRAKFVFSHRFPYGHVAFNDRKHWMRLLGTRKASFSVSSMFYKIHLVILLSTFQMKL